MLQSYKEHLQAPLESGAVRADGTCGTTEAQTAVILLVYHKMGTVWWHFAALLNSVAHQTSLHEYAVNQTQEVLQKDVYTVTGDADNDFTVPAPFRAMSACMLPHCLDRCHLPE